MKNSQESIINNINTSQEYQAAKIIYEAFKRKISVLIKDQEIATELIKISCNFECAFYIAFNNDIVGVIGMRTLKCSFLKFKYSCIRKYFSIIKSMILYLILNYDNFRKQPDNELKIEAIAVKKEARNMGIGTKLLEHITQFAKEKGYKYLSLDVVDTNNMAKMLYERLGFVEIKKVRYGFITRRAGFTGSSLMKKELF